MQWEPTQPQAGQAPPKRSLDDLSNVDTSSAKPPQCSARLSSNAASAAAQRRCNLDALPQHLFRDILDTLSRKDVGAAAATCKRFATEWRHAAGASAVLFPQLSAEGCTRLRQFASDAYASCSGLLTETAAQDYLVKKLPGRFDSHVIGVASYDIFYGPLLSRWVYGLEVKICHYDSSCSQLDGAVAFWGLAEDLPRILTDDKDLGAHVAESVIY